MKAKQRAWTTRKAQGDERETCLAKRREALKKKTAEAKGKEKVPQGRVQHIIIWVVKPG